MGEGALQENGKNLLRMMALNGSREGKIKLKLNYKQESIMIRCQRRKSLHRFLLIHPILEVPTLERK